MGKVLERFEPFLLAVALGLGLLLGLLFSLSPAVNLHILQPPGEKRFESK